MDLQVGTEMSITLGDDGVSMEVVTEEQLYCICQTPWDVNNRRFMIHCDHCQNWFHGDCVGITEKEANYIESYNCARCEEVAGPSKYKSRSELEGNRKLMNQRCSPEFRRRLKEFFFLPADEVILTTKSGDEVKLDDLVSKGFFRPIVVEKMNGLGIRIPPNTFTVRDIERYVDSERMVDVIDVEKQTELKMKFGQFIEYFTDPDRKRLLNLISLEVSDTKLGGLIEAPHIARKLDFLNKHWPAEAATPEGLVDKPKVSKYCLISSKDSYTDFHIDFGGTSVWYHILWGQKIFYLMEPTKVNLDLYNRWLGGEFGNDCFLPDEVQQCYRCVLNKGETLFIPTGWIHAVYTPHDSLVFGGNFLHKLNMGLQLQIHAMERKSAIAAKYLFPLFETTHWYAANGLIHELKRYHKKTIPPHVLQGVRILIKTLKAWIDEYEKKKEAIPVGIDAQFVIKELTRELRLAEKYSRKFSEKSGGSPKLVLNTGSFPLVDERSKSSVDLAVSLKAETAVTDSPLGSPEVRIKMKISRKSLDDWSPSPHTSEGGEKGGNTDDKFTTPSGVSQKENLSVHKGLGEPGEEDSRSSFDGLFIDETMEKHNKKWDTDSVVSSDSHNKRDKTGKHRHHKSKHKKKHSNDYGHSSKHKHKSQSTASSKERSIRMSLKVHEKQKNMSLNDALAGALDGMEELIKSSNYAERVAQSQDTPDGVKETIVGLGAMTDSILAKSSQDGYDDFDLKQVHQDDDYIYLPLVASDDESTKRSKKKQKKSRDDDDETWSPTGKLGNVGSRNTKAARHHAKRKAVEKGLKEAASRPLKVKRSQLSTSPKMKSFTQKSCDKKKKSSKAGPSKASTSFTQPSSSTSSAAAGGSSLNLKDSKKWKKGMQTPKQRLSKILKMGKFFNH